MDNNLQVLFTAMPRTIRQIRSDIESQYADEATQTALGPTPPASQYKGKDDEYASTTRKLARIALENGRPQESVIKAAKSKRDAQPPPALKPEVAAAQEDLSKKSWSKRALARTKDILSITAKEPSTFAFEEFREREFKKAGVKAGDNAAAKLHVSSQKLPPEAPRVQSKEPPPITRNATDTNTNANKSVGRFKSIGAKTTDGKYAGQGKISDHSLASSSSNHSSARLGSGRVSFTGSAQGSASGSGSAGGSETGQGQSMGQPAPRLRHSQTDGSASRVGTATSPGRGQMAPTKVLSGKQKAAAIDDRW